MNLPAPSQPDLSLATAERLHVLATLRDLHGNRSQTAKALGLAPRSLSYRLARYKAQGYPIPPGAPPGRPRAHRA